MYRGTTPHIELEFPFSLNGVTDIYVTFSQCDKEIFTI